jgi:hypothetical protein
MEVKDLAERVLPFYQAKMIHFSVAPEIESLCRSRRKWLAALGASQSQPSVVALRCKDVKG